MHAVRAMKGQPLAGLTINDERLTFNDERGTMNGKSSWRLRLIAIGDC